SILRGFQELIGIEAPVHHREGPIVDIIIARRRFFDRGPGRSLIASVTGDLISGILILHGPVARGGRGSNKLAIEKISQAGQQKDLDKAETATAEPANAAQAPPLDQNAKRRW